MMIPHPKSVLYACVSKGTTILADFAFNDPSLLTLASRCLQFTPPHHSVYSHTVSGRTYHFLIDAGEPDRPFVYFGIFDEALNRSDERLLFLNGVKQGFDAVLARNSEFGTDHLSFKCFQDDMDLVFRRLLELPLNDFDDGVPSSIKASDRNVSSDSSCSSQLNVVKPLLGKIKREAADSIRIINGESNGASRDKETESKLDVLECDQGNDDGLIDVFSGSKISNVDATVASFKERKMARWTLRRRVGLVLLMDLLICTFLFGVWLSICKGFKCLA